MKSVYVIVLNYNNCEDTIECLNGLQSFNAANVALKLIVVDNASTDNSVARLKAALAPNAMLVENPKNLGYAAGNNVGIKIALEDGADYICVLNNDTIIEENFICPCIEFLETDSSLGVIGPTIMEADNDSVQSTGGDIFLTRGFVTIKNHGKCREKLPHVIECDYVGGACMIFRADLINQIGMIPENYFLFFEETEWCYKVKKAGYKNACLNKTYIRHKGSATIDKIGGLHAYLMERNRVVFMRRNCQNKAEYVCGVLYLFIKYAWFCIVKDISYLKYFAYMKDGILNKVDNKTYPFVVILE